MELSSVEEATRYWEEANVMALIVTDDLDLAERVNLREPRETLAS